MHYDKGKHTVFHHRYHLVWITKYRYPVLKGKIRLRVRELARQVCAELDVDIISGVLSADHIHMFVSIPPKLSVSYVMQRIKGRTSRKIQMEFPVLRKRYWGRRFWARGYFCTTSGPVTDDLITSETLVNQDSHIQERVLSIHEIVNSQKLQTYNEGLRSYLTVIHITGDKAYLAFLEKFLTSNAHGFLKKNALKNYFKRTPENKWSEHLFVYEFLTETPYVLSDDLHLWQSFSKFASNLGFTSDANVAQAIMLALLGDSLMAEQLMTGVISHPKQGKFQIEFILETYKRLLENP